MGIRRNFRPTNIVSNGDFRNGVTGWTGVTATLAVADNTMSFTGSVANDNAYAQAYNNTAITSVSGKKVYARAIMRVTNAVCSGLQLVVDGVDAGTNVTYGVANPTENQWYTLAQVAIQPADVSGLIQIKLIQTYADAATQNGKVAEVKEVIAIDCSTLPTELQALSDANLKTVLDSWPWFNGTLSGGKRIA